MTLEMRPTCGCCDAALPADVPGAVVCSFECTYCAGCAGHLGGTCPNCEGDLVARPTRTGEALERTPASTERVSDPGECPGRVEPDARVERLTRKPERALGDRAALDALLDEVLAGTLSTVVDGRPWSVPMLFARDGDRVLLHGSTGAGALRHVAAGAPAALTVLSVDGLVVAHSTFDSSANYRSAVVHGDLVPLSGGEQERALDVLSERLVPGRTSEVRPSTRRERAATLAVALPITEGRWLLKQRDGGPGDPDEETTAWSGVVPFRVVTGDPEPSPHALSIGAPTPASVEALVERGRA